MYEFYMEKVWLTAHIRYTIGHIRERSARAISMPDIIELVNVPLQDSSFLKKHCSCGDIEMCKTIVRKKISTRKMNASLYDTLLQRRRTNNKILDNKIQHYTVKESKKNNPFPPSFRHVVNKPDK
jgi:hypothetical protein